MGNPVLPSHPENPAGQTARIREARRAWARHIKPIRKWLASKVDSLPKRLIEVNHERFAINRYEYLISASAIDELVAELQRRLNADRPATGVMRQVEMSYESGTADEMVNLISITDGAYTRTMTEILRSDSWRQRVAMIEARVFEEMKGFQGDTGVDLARVLRQGVSDGRNPLDIARDIRERFDVSQSRANRIARTEVTGAYRRARWDEDADANQRLGIRTGLMHLSALSPTTRSTHAQRHGNIYTQEQVREWYAIDGNAIQCKCSQVSVLLDEDGRPTNPKFVERVRASKK
jgi:SPP1 gp7 family putative phage head morphogenesis protein